MKYGIRFQLITAFVLVAIIPLTVIIGMISLVSANISKNPEFIYLTDLNKFFDEVTMEIQRDFSFIEDNKAITEDIKKFLAQYTGFLIIMDNDGNILYESEGANSFSVEEHYVIDASKNIGSYYSKKSEEYVKFVEPIIKDKKYLGSTIFIYKEDNVFSNVIDRTRTYFVGVLLMGVVIFIALLALSTRLISRNILVPLKKLNDATKKIARGELDFTIEHSKRNEIGSFCETFEYMRKELKTAIEKQREIENAKKEVIASISHDLRTPMTSIRGYVEAIKDGKATNPQRLKEYLDIIERKTESMDRLIDDLSQFSKLELGKIEMCFKQTDSIVMLEQIAASSELAFADSGMKLLIKRPFPSAIINADILRITQVIDNVFENARRYSKGETIVMEAVLASNKLRIIIRDDGIGISDTDLPKIFDRFYRGEKSRSRDYGGTGLGLAICKYIVEEHKGHIWAKSKKGHGTEIWIELPLAE